MVSMNLQVFLSSWRMLAEPWVRVRQNRRTRPSTIWKSQSKTRDKVRIRKPRTAKAGVHLGGRRIEDM